MTETATRARASRAPDIRASLDAAIDRATQALIDCRQPDGHWVFELEADATIPSEYILLRHYFGEPIDTILEEKVANYLCRVQADHGGWSLIHHGPFDMSASVKAYFALKMIGHPTTTPHMQRAREAILARGGAIHCNVFTRVLLCLFGIMDWRSVPMMPVEIMLFPRWFSFHLSKISYWARTVLVPLLVIQVLKPRAENLRGVIIDELFQQPPKLIGLAGKAAHQNWLWFSFFRSIDEVLRYIDRFGPVKFRRRAIDEAVHFVSQRLNGNDGLGAIFPAMANAAMMFAALDGAENEEKARIARRSIERLLVVTSDQAYCQPCLSPVWDSALACHALLEVGNEEAVGHARAGLAWLARRQELNVAGDWGEQRPLVQPGGWAFQYANPHYPDLDDTAVVVMAMDRFRTIDGGNEFDTAINRGVEWISGMQSRDGGWAAFDVDNTFDHLNNIPFADHGALIDPPTEDVTARCVSMLAQLDGTREKDLRLSRGIDFLLRKQMPEGSWYGRWGMNYIYGTWSALCAFNAAGMPHHAPETRRAVHWLLSIQNADGGWGEDASSYRLDYSDHESAPSTPSQTSWALLGLMTAGETLNPAVQRGIRYLLQAQNEDGFWDEERFTATGFPRVFYLRYHGYRKYFPLWALARYRNLISEQHKRVEFGM
jgi:squalene-hopene/tetraprenyl-beta-curcumene cyclase